MLLELPRESLLLDGSNLLRKVLQVVVPSMVESNGLEGVHDRENLSRRYVLCLFNRLFYTRMLHPDRLKLVQHRKVKVGFRRDQLGTEGSVLYAAKTLNEITDCRKVRLLVQPRTKLVSCSDSKGHDQKPWTLCPFTLRETFATVQK
jgi:hypothetical protein